MTTSQGHICSAACTNGLSRRHAIAGAAATGLGVSILAACGGDDSASGGDSGGGYGGGSGGESGGGSGGGQAGALATTVEIPEGGGMIFSDAGVVVTQPAAGEFRAFSTTCTHQGCSVNEVAENIACPCHGSQFSIEDGSAVQGPASDPLEEIPITVEGDQVLLG